MPILSLQYDFSVTVGGRTRRFASPTVPTLLTLDDDPSDFVVELAATEIRTVWNPTLADHGGLPASFDFLFALAIGGPAQLELVADADGGATKRVFSVTLAAGVPFVLGSDNTFADFTASGDSFAGVADVINQLRLRNPSATEAITVRIALGP
jgi:hypothetical protein